MRSNIFYEMLVAPSLYFFHKMLLMQYNHRATEHFCKDANCTLSHIIYEPTDTHVCLVWPSMGQSIQRAFPLQQTGFTTRWILSLFDIKNWSKIRKIKITEARNKKYLNTLAKLQIPEPLPYITPQNLDESITHYTHYLPQICSLCIERKRIRTCSKTEMWTAFYFLAG